MTNHSRKHWARAGQQNIAVSLTLKGNRRCQSFSSIAEPDAESDETVLRIRDLHMKEGDRMTFTLLPGGAVLMRMKNKSAVEIPGQPQKRVRL
jgi:hypothetical protein